MDRFFDIFFSSLALILLVPFLIPVSIILYFTGEGEVFFLQERIGKNGKIFKLYKFATMLKNSPSVGTRTVTIKNDPRVLPFGKILRKTKINELPQLINVFLGSMSIIGPRPLTKEAFSSYNNYQKKIILEVRPGLSGLGSIIFHDEEELLKGNLASLEFYKNDIAPFKGEVEAWFVNNKSIFIYFVAIFLTLWVMINKKAHYVWKFFPTLPKPSNKLKELLNIEPIEND